MYIYFRFDYKSFSDVKVPLRKFHLNDGTLVFHSETQHVSLLNVQLLIYRFTFLSGLCTQGRK